jgi:hypothetical protein
MWRLARIVLLSTTAGAFSLPALAADLPDRMEPVAPVAYVPVFIWTGFLSLGENLGGYKRTPDTPRARFCWARLSSSRPDLTRMG